MYKKINIILLFIMTFSYSTCMASDIKSDKKSSITLLGGIGSRESINLLLKKAKLLPPYSYFLGVGYRSHEIFSTPIKLNLETIKHFGRQNSVELVLYPSIESPPVYLGNMGFSWGIGEGISVMVGPYPKFEEYHSVKTQRLLNFLLIEQNMFLSSYPEAQLTLRWHHRCNLFGTIAPQGAGSNFLSIGFRHNF